MTRLRRGATVLPLLKKISRVPPQWPSAALCLSWLLTPLAVARLLNLYSTLRVQYRASLLAAWVLPPLLLLLRMFINVRSPQLNYITRHFYQLYPQLRHDKVSFSDLPRFFIQSLFLLSVHLQPKQYNLKNNHFVTQCKRLQPLFIRHWHRMNVRLSYVSRRLFRKQRESGLSSIEQLTQAPIWQIGWLRKLLIAAILGLSAIVITVPFSVTAQATFVALILFVAYSLRHVSGRLPTLLMITLSISTATRYMWWRYTETLYFGDFISAFLGIGLLLAESYTWLVLVLGFFQTIQPLHRKPVPLPDDTALWPTVDIYIPTYNEPLSVVRPTAIAAMSMDYPKDKFRVYILDDGRRPHFKDFADEIGIGYIIRPDNNHAKAGNLNHAMKQTSGDYIAIFDCDHVPVRSFLQMTIGTVVEDPKVCLVQTPHHFFSADPFERNLDTFAKIPNENMLFYGVVQDGNDLWDATFFCGSCAVIKREAVNSIGGFAFETVTEDAHTALRMQRAGYKTAYINIPQAAGLATESLSAHVGQRIRWARGMAQIFRVDNPLLGRGLSWAQRLCYLNAMMHFMHGIPRLVFLTAPLAYILLNAYVIYAPFITIMLYVVPTLIQVQTTNSRLQGKYRYSFWGEVYETVLAWYITRPTTVALINPKKGKFNVTEKGGLNSDMFYDWGISTPYLILLGLNLLGAVIGVLRIPFAESFELGVLAICLAWLSYNLLILGAAVAVAAEARQVRRSHRIHCLFDGAIVTSSGHMYPVKVTDFSDAGVGVKLNCELDIKAGEHVQVVLQQAGQETNFPCYVCNVRDQALGLSLHELSLPQQIAFVQSTFGRADAWLDWKDNFQHDAPMKSLLAVAHTSARGYKNLVSHGPEYVQTMVGWLANAGRYFYSFVPRLPKLTMEPKQ